MLCAAQDERRSAFGEGNEHVVAIAQPMRVADQGGNVVDWNPSDLLPFLADNEKTPIKREIAAITGNFDDAADHSRKPGSLT